MYFKTVRTHNMTNSTKSTNCHALRQTKTSHLDAANSIMLTFSKTVRATQLDKLNKTQSLADKISTPRLGV